jgi:hypothetical protein
MKFKIILIALLSLLFYYCQTIPDRKLQVKPTKRPITILLWKIYK